MIRFRVWLDRNILGVERYRQIVERPDSATDEECGEACKDCLDEMIDSWINTGREEIK